MNIDPPPAGYHNEAGARHVSKFPPTVADTITVVLLGGIAGLLVLASFATLISYHAGDPGGTGFRYDSEGTAWKYVSRGSIADLAQNVLGYAFITAGAIAAVAAGMLATERGTASRAVRTFLVTAIVFSGTTALTVVLNVLSVRSTPTRMDVGFGSGSWLCVLIAAVALVSAVITAVAAHRRPAEHSVLDFVATVPLLVFAALLVAGSFTPLYHRSPGRVWRGLEPFRVLGLPLFLAALGAVGAMVLLISGRRGSGRAVAAAAAACGSAAALVVVLDAWDRGIAPVQTFAEMAVGWWLLVAACVAGLTVFAVTIRAEATGSRSSVGIEGP
ncbi:hypothetical protein [Nocardia sp. NPDC051832]|uniref:hypothetical protein n=1 Tax=Nocardia sp. NPDC051832 TaxID=3155673 RepID=UPI00344893CF